MIRLWLLLSFLWVGPAHAQTVRATSGEHDGFTRLVFDYGKPVDWKMGRTQDGYQMRLKGTAPAYDLTAVFNLIGKSRLASIWAEPEGGDLNIGLACACHAIPFEFRPGIIVIDLKDGPPPKGSSFEIPLQGAAAAPPLGAQAAPRPRRRPDKTANGDNRLSDTVETYDWIFLAYDTLRDVKGKPNPASGQTSILLRPDPGLQPLRDQILHHIARGASQGVVDMALPDRDELALPTADFPSTQIRIGEAKTSVNRKDRSVSSEFGAQGMPCLNPDLLAIASWGNDSQSLTEQMANTRNGLSGEFDKPDDKVVSGAIEFQLFLGFGAEARQMIAAFSASHDKAPIWKSLSYLIDGEPDPNGVFDGQAACTGPAALWAVLGDDKLQPGDAIDAGAIRLAFTDLPLHLRRHLGPQLSERLREIGSEETARALRDSITRAPGEAGGAVTLMEAEANLHTGNAAKAESVADAIMADPGPNQPQALITLTEARIAQNLPISADIALALQAHLADHKGSGLETKLQEALILAEAASGNFAAAFHGLQAHPHRQSEIWKMLGSLAADKDLLSFAVLDLQSPPPKVSDETAEIIARRLTAFGLGGAAERWLSTVAAPDPVLVAAAAVRRSDARAALDPLGGTNGPETQTLKLQALSLLGEDRLQADLLETMGDLPAASAALARAGDWERLAQSGQEPWKSIAARLTETPAPSASDPAPPYGPLARGQDLVKADQDTRSAIYALLAAVPAP